MAGRDLPGFHRDPVTGRYLTESPLGVNNPRMSRGDVECSVIPSIGNVIGLLRKRELGTVSAVPAEKEYTQLRAKNKKIIDVNTVPTVLQRRYVTNINYIKGDETSLSAVWSFNTGRGMHYSVANRDFLNDAPPITYRLQGSVSDIYHSPHIIDVVVYKYPRSSVKFICGRTVEHSAFNVGETMMTRSDSRNVFYSCTGFQRERVIAIGGTNAIQIFNRLTRVHNFQVNGDIYSLSPLESSGSLLAGMNNGVIKLYDVNQTNLVQHLEVSTNGINDSLFLDSNNVIVADCNNMLIKVDLRVNDVVAQYHGHKSSLTKTPFSVGSNILCATGSDKMIRLWHIAGGNPIEEMKPGMNFENEIRGWINMDNFYYFESDFEEKYKF